jgi:hypothetical protein
MEIVTAPLGIPLPVVVFWLTHPEARMDPERLNDKPFPHCVKSDSFSSVDISSKAGKETTEEWYTRVQLFLYSCPELDKAIRPASGVIAIDVPTES